MLGLKPEMRDTQARPVVNTGEGRTKQSMQKDTDINLIVAKYQKTGILSFVSKVQPEFMEVDNIDFHTAMDVIVKSNELFAQMPSSMRKRFDNNPEKYLEFVHNPDNLEEMYELGLANRPPAPPPDPAPAPAPAPAPDPAPAPTP